MGAMSLVNVGVGLESAVTATAGATAIIATAGARIPRNFDVRLISELLLVHPRPLGTRRAAILHEPVGDAETP